MERTCDHCQKPYAAKRRDSRYCSSTCRSRAHTGRPGAAVVAMSAPPLEGAGSLALVTERELTTADRLDTVQGQAALMLARRLDSASADTGASVAALVRELKATMVDALRGVSTTVDPVDELRRKRDQRRAAAG